MRREKRSVAALHEHFCNEMGVDFSHLQREVDSRISSYIYSDQNIFVGPIKKHNLFKGIRIVFPRKATPFSNQIQAG